jgi:hypothetical protein
VLRDPHNFDAAPATIPLLFTILIYLKLIAGNLPMQGGSGKYHQSSKKLFSFQFSMKSFLEQFKAQKIIFQIKFTAENSCRLYWLSLLAAVKAVKMCKSVFMSCSLNPRLTC